MIIVMCIWITSNFFTDYNSTNIVINDVANKLAYVSGYGVVLSGLLFTYFFL